MASSWLLVWIPTPSYEIALRKTKKFAYPSASNVSEQSNNDDDRVTEENEFVITGTDNKTFVVSTTSLAKKEEPEEEEEKQNERKADLPIIQEGIELNGIQENGDSQRSLSPNSGNIEYRPYTYADVLDDILHRKLRIETYLKELSKDKRFELVKFCIPSHQVELVLVILQQHGFGTSDLTSISVIPASIHIQPEMEDKLKTPEISKMDQKVDKFYQSVKSRMLVVEVIEKIRAGAEFTFDFLMLLVLASIIAFFGLVENNSVILVASMLVSPLMGPILAGTFGTVIRDRKLQRYGIIHELIALLLCILIGLILGCCFSPWIETYGVPAWPTSEMVSRGKYRSLWVGVLIAIPSGAGVALSVLGGNAGSLVGVAISASLLPPAVNAGLWWSIAIVNGCSKEDFHLNYTEPNEYSDDYVVEAVAMGSISLLLTIVNIVCIIITGILILKLKEVTPEKIPQNFSAFWKKDIKVHRDYMSTVKDPKLSTNLLLEARQVLGTNEAEGLEGTFLQNLFEKAQQEENFINIQRWLTSPPSGNQSNYNTFLQTSTIGSLATVRSRSNTFVAPAMPKLLNYNALRKRSISVDRGTEDQDQAESGYL